MFQFYIFIIIIYFSTGNDNQSDSNANITVPRFLLNTSDAYVLTRYRSSALLQLSPPPEANTSDYNFTIDSEVLGFSFTQGVITNISEPIIIELQSIRSQSNMVSDLGSLSLSELYVQIDV